MERDIEISKGVIETLTPLLSDYSQHFSVTFQHSDGRLISVYCNTSEFVSELFHLPLFRQIPVWLGRWSKNRWTDEPQSWNHFAIDSLNCWLFGQSAAIITSFKREKFMQVIDKVILLSYYVQLASRFWCHFTCIVCKRINFPWSKTQVDSCFRHLDDSYMWHKSGTFAPFSKSVLGTIWL